MSTETEVIATEAPEQPSQNPVEQATQTGGDEAPQQDAGEKPAEGDEPKAEDKPKKEKTQEEKEIARLRRRVDNLTKRLYQSGANSQQGLQPEPIERDNRPQQADSEELRLSRAELNKLIEQRANELAPTIRKQSDEIEQRRKVVEKLAATWGQEKFDALASDLDDAFGGLTDKPVQQGGKPRPAVEAIFESDDPQALIEYLADPDNAAEAEALSRLSPIQAGRAVTRLEDKLKAKKAEEKPKRSQAPEPIEPLRGAGKVDQMPDPSNTKAYIEWANRQERRGRA